MDVTVETWQLKTVTGFLPEYGPHPYRDTDGYLRSHLHPLRKSLFATKKKKNDNCAPDRRFDYKLCPKLSKLAYD